MILKSRIGGPRLDDSLHDQWILRDNIRKISYRGATFKDYQDWCAGHAQENYLINGVPKDTGPFHVLWMWIFFEDGREVSIATDYEIYLLNDAGKTIERLY